MLIGTRRTLGEIWPILINRTDRDPFPDARDSKESGVERMRSFILGFWDVQTSSVETGARLTCVSCVCLSVIEFDGL